MRWTAPLRPILRTGESLLDRVLCVAGAVTFCQFPEFIQQYLQRLGGHLDEAKRQLATYESTAKQFNITLDQFIERSSAVSDPVVAQHGHIMRGVVERVQELSTAEAALRNASLWEKPFVFFAHLDRSIASATWDVYRPAVPTTTEGLIYAAAGMIAILAVYHGGVRYPIVAANKARVARRVKRKTEETAPSSKN